MTRYVYRCIPVSLFFELTRMPDHLRDDKYCSDDAGSRNLAELYKQGFKLHDITDGYAVFARVLRDCDQKSIARNPFIRPEIAQ